MTTDEQYQEAARITGRLDEITALLVERDEMRNALEDIASGNWQRYPQRERHGQITVQGYAQWVLNHD